jgi:hypothetical protein
MNWLIQLLTVSAGPLPAGKRDTSFGHVGLAPGWAFFVFLLLLAATIWTYTDTTAGSPRWRRWALISLRAGSILVFLVLLVKPVVNLTISEPIRQTLLVLLDRSQSMALSDKRDKPEDIQRAALAAGLMDPHHGLANVALGAAAVAQVRSLTRWDLLEKLAANDRLALWPRLYRKSDLAFYGFGHDAAFVGKLEPPPGASLNVAAAAHFFASLAPAEPATAIGESLREVLGETRGQPLAGVLLITDGGNNSGLPPVEAAQLAHEENLPLFIYGIGITSPPDLSVQDVDAPKVAFIKERAEIHARLHSQAITGRTVIASLQANGSEVDAQPVKLDHEGDYDLVFQFEPAEAGELKLAVSVPVQPEEAVGENNVATASLRVIDTKVNVLLIEQEPRWDFRYLLAYLERDPRLSVHAVMIDGEPNLDRYPDSPFLPGLPADRDGIFRNQVIILGDVNPADLGAARMALIREWTGAGGGMIFLAGAHFDPTAYAGTPLEALLPIVPLAATGATGVGGDRSSDLVPLRLTAAGNSSPYLRMTPDPAANRQTWDHFPGVRWTAPVARAKPGAEVLLVDPRPERAGANGPEPVFATQPYGAGTCVYIGTDETYRWRSRVGEKFYAIFWGQIMQSLALQKLQDTSSLTQLRIAKQQFVVGDKIVIAGKVYRPGFEPLTVPTLEATLTRQTRDATGQVVSQTTALNLLSTSGQGDYRGEFIARAPGEYQLSTREDSAAVLKFTVTEPKLELLRTGLNEHLLQAMAAAAHGRLLREEDLDQLPDLIAAKGATAAAFRQVDLYTSPWWLVPLCTCLFLEWLLRRLTRLK